MRLQHGGKDVKAGQRPAISHRCGRAPRRRWCGHPQNARHALQRCEVQAAAGGVCKNCRCGRWWSAEVGAQLAVQRMAGGDCVVTVATDHHFHRARPCADQLHFLRLDHGRRDGNSYGQSKPHQHEAGEVGCVAQGLHGKHYCRPSFHESCNNPPHAILSQRSPLDPPCAGGVCAVLGGCHRISAGEASSDAIGLCRCWNPEGLDRWRRGHFDLWRTHPGLPTVCTGWCSAGVGHHWIPAFGLVHTKGARTLVQRLAHCRE